MPLVQSKVLLEFRKCISWREVVYLWTIKYAPDSNGRVEMLKRSLNDLAMTIIFNINNQSQEL